MNEWVDELHAALLHLSGYMNRPDIDVAFLERAGVKLDRALFPLLSRIGLSAPIGVVELGHLAGRDHSTISRQVTKLEALGLVERQPAADDQRVRLLRPTDTGAKMLLQLRKARRRLMAEHFKDWTTEDRDQLVELLGRMSNKVRSSRNNGAG